MKFLQRKTLKTSKSKKLVKPTKSLMKKKGSLTRKIKKMMNKLDYNDQEPYINILKEFEKFFTILLKIENKIISEKYGGSVLNKFDEIKLEISDKLQAIDDEKGSLINRINHEAPDIMKILNTYLNTNNSDDIIEVYSDVLRGLRKIRYHKTIRSDVSRVQTLLTAELIKEFIDVENPKESDITDELMGMFEKKLSIQNNGEGNLLDIIQKLKNTKI